MKLKVSLFTSTSLKMKRRLSMLRKFFATVMILFAIVLAVLGISLPRANIQWIIVITNFFDIMIPVLAVGALVNYLWKSCSCCHTKE
jgi:hypothetical protein